jgi:hypothetical protein
MLPNSICRGGRKLFLPQLHLWYRPVPSKLTNLWTVEIGLTDRCLQDLGDIQRLYSDYLVGKPVTNGKAILRLDWDGYMITDGDEMYHTVWKNIEGTYTIKSPVDGKLEYMASKTDIIDEDQVLLEISTTEESLGRAIQYLVCEEEYDKLKEFTPPGTFAQVDGLR